MAAALGALLLVPTGGLTAALADSVATNVTCTPSSGTISANSSVSCGIALGTGASLVFWSTSGFSPIFSHNPSDTFTATGAGAGSITATYQDATGAHQQTFSYTINPSTVTSTATCSPSGGDIDFHSTVSCSFTAAPGARLMFWTARGFSPLFSHNASDTFTATRSGPASIIATYIAPGGAHQIEFDFNIGPPPAP